MDQGFVSIAKLKVCFPVRVLVKVSVSFNIFTYCTLLHLIILTDIFKGHSLVLTKYGLSFLKHLKETVGPGVKRPLSSSFIYKR